MTWRNHHRWENQVTWCSVEWPGILLSPFYTLSEQKIVNHSHLTIELLSGWVFKNWGGYRGITKRIWQKFLVENYIEVHINNSYICMIAHFQWPQPYNWRFGWICDCMLWVNPIQSKNFYYLFFCCLTLILSGFFGLCMIGGGVESTTPPP